MQMRRKRRLISYADDFELQPVKKVKFDDFDIQPVGLKTIPLPLGSNYFAKNPATATIGGCTILERKEVVGEMKYYVHFRSCDRRMDTWLSRDAFVFDVPEEMKEEMKAEEELHSKEHAHPEFDPEVLERHNEVTKLKNVERVFFGSHWADAWYFSPFPEEFWDKGTLYFCEMCLHYFTDPLELTRHKRRCTMHHPPGDEIYRCEAKDGKTYCMFEVDGFTEKFYCQRLCLLSKLFLDHKTLEYEPAPFLFYNLCRVDEQGCQLVGYFSKEKICEDRYNVSCILTLPWCQKQGFGTFLIDFSYLLSSIESDYPGSPERPLSDLGKITYMRYWGSHIMEVLRELPKRQRNRISVKELSRLTGYRKDDVLMVLQEWKMLHRVQGEFVIVITDELIERYSRKGKKKMPTPIQDKLSWFPYILRKHEDKDVNSTYVPVYDDGPYPRE